MSDDAGSRFVASGVGAFFAEVITLPADVVKVRLQIQSSASAVRYYGFADCVLRTAREEGVLALWKGLAPALIRQVSYTSLSFVIYEPIRDMYRGLLPGGLDNQPTYAVRLLAGGTAGGLAIAIFNPSEVVKTQVQADQGRLRMRDVVSRVWTKDGVFGFWAGVRPNVTRTFLVCAAELGTYDEAKQRLKPHLGDGLLAHVGASGIAGFVSACVSTPADVVKTRLMNSAGGVQQYRGMLHAFSSILVDEGSRALYKGFFPICVRKLIWCASFFVTYEKVRVMANQY